MGPAGDIASRAARGEYRDRAQENSALAATRSTAIERRKFHVDAPEAPRCAGVAKSAAPTARRDALHSADHDGNTRDI
jgi:hypothetical protein